MNFNKLRFIIIPTLMLLLFSGFYSRMGDIYLEISKNIEFCKHDIENYIPDKIIFIDYSGFNLRIAKWAKEHSFNTNYFIMN